MPPLIHKRCKDQIRERTALSARIAKHGIEKSPCSFCERNTKKCIVSSDGSARCSECARLGKKCDVKSIPIDDWDSLEREERRIEKEREATLERLLKLDKQMKFLKTRGREMLRQGLKSLDDLDEINDAKEKEQYNLYQKQQSTVVTLDPPDTVYVDSFHMQLSPSFWAL
jgi:hypothetical protein